jgi:hypothetical protein
MAKNKNISYLQTKLDLDHHRGTIVDDGINNLTIKNI